MTEKLEVNTLKYIPASQEENRTGLMGWVSCTLNGCILLSGIAVRRTRDGRRTLSFPARKDGAGLIHHFYKPLDRETQLEIERQVFLALGMEGTA